MKTPALIARWLQHPAPPLLLLLTLILLPQAAAQERPRAVAGGAAFDVLHYDIDLEPLFDASAVNGSVSIRFKSRRDRLSEIEFDRGELSVDGVAEQGRAQAFELKESKLLIRLARPARMNETRTLSIRYHGKPTRGIRFYTDVVYTVFNTSEWVVCRDAPEDRASVHMRLTLPVAMKGVANGRLIERRLTQDGKAQHIWEQSAPISTYIFGFAAGRFQEHVKQHGRVRLRFLTRELTGAEVERVFAATGAMLDFFERRAGVLYPDETYTQVLAPGNIDQEMGSFTVMHESYAREILAQPQETWLMAHELSHQWWGNSLTCLDWSDFWLNEGFASFMADAFKQDYETRDEYERGIELARQRYARARAQGRDRAIVSYNWVRPSDMSGPITYSKGELVLHLLRFQLGEEKFWQGIRRYTRRHAGRSVVTADFRSAMERAAGQDLSQFFQHWVYRTDAPDIYATHRAQNGEVIIELEQRQSALWPIPLQVAVETTGGRRSRRILLEARRHEARFPLDGSLLSVRLDDGGHLPVRVKHARGASMLLRQLAHEPDVAGRMDALEELQTICGGGPEARAEAACDEFKAALTARAGTDASRLVRQAASRILEGIKQ